MYVETVVGLRGWGRRGGVAADCFLRAEGYVEG